MRIKLTAADSFALGVGLPWELPLETWPDELLVQMPRGISRNVVRFVHGDGDTVFALKEVPERVALREYELLRTLRDRGLPSVEAVGLVTGRISPEGRPLMTILVTRYLERAMPYRVLFEGATRWPAGQAAGRAGGPADPVAHRRLLLGRLLPVQHPVPPRRRPLGGLSGGRGDGGAAPGDVRRHARL
ncbi:hypothetical protein [Aerophototrophica crusticola]|uniref:hypothetical protein n=1 Tax=Aerophototrophica crusticola TaxID=1709002 RepID=UPI00384DB747